MNNKYEAKLKQSIAFWQFLSILKKFPGAEGHYDSKIKRWRKDFLTTEFESMLIFLRQMVTSRILSGELESITAVTEDFERYMVDSGERGESFLDFMGKDDNEFDHTELTSKQTDDLQMLIESKEDAEHQWEVLGLILESIINNDAPHDYMSFFKDIESTGKSFKVNSKPIPIFVIESHRSVDELYSDNAEIERYVSMYSLEELLDGIKGVTPSACGAY